MNLRALNPGQILLFAAATLAWVVLALGLAACGDDNATPTPATPNATLPAPPASPTSSPVVIKASGSIELPRDNGGRWVPLLLVPGQGTFLAEYVPSVSTEDYGSFQMRLAPFDPIRGLLKDIAVAAPDHQMGQVGSDGQFVAWLEVSLNCPPCRGWKVFALDMETGDKWEVAADSVTSDWQEFRPPPFPQYLPFLSVQGGRLAYSVLTTDSSGNPAYYELRLLDLKSRESETVLGPVDPREASFTYVSLYGDNLVWMSYARQGDTMLSQDLWRMHLPDGEREILDSGYIGDAFTIYKNMVVYGKQPDADYSLPDRLIYTFDLETGEKRQLAYLTQEPETLHLTDRFAYWPDPDTSVGMLVDLQTGGTMNLGTERVWDVFLEGGRVFWYSVKDDPSGNPSEDRDFLEWADLPEWLP